MTEYHRILKEVVWKQVNTHVHYRLSKSVNFAAMYGRTFSIPSTGRIPCNRTTAAIRSEQAIVRGHRLEVTESEQRFFWELQTRRGDVILHGCTHGLDSARKAVCRALYDRVRLFVELPT